MSPELLYASIIGCWFLNLVFISSFLKRWYDSEKSKTKAFAALGAVALPPLIISFLLPARSGYDNNHSFISLGMSFFGSRPGVLLSFKEISPLFTDGIADLVSGGSLKAILIKNRILPFFSTVLAFAALRRLGAGLTVSAAGCGLFFMNFLSLIGASSFSTTSANIFIWTASLAALADTAALKAPGAGALAWIAASGALVAAGRFEFIPVNLALLGALAVTKRGSLRTAAVRPLTAGILAAGALLALLWGAWVLGHNSAAQLGSGRLRPLTHAAYQLGEKNLAVAAGLRSPAEDGPGDRRARPDAAALTALFVAAALGLTLLPVMAGQRPDYILLGAGLIGAAYFSYIFVPLDLYPLHFTRHQLYFFLPFAGLFTLGLQGAARYAAALAPSRSRLLGALCWCALALYGALNAKAALARNAELRTDDRELAFLMRAAADWPRGCRAAFAARPRGAQHFNLLNKYFPAADGASLLRGDCALKYVSAEDQVFAPDGNSPLHLAPLTGSGSETWRTETFKHAFYTTFDKPGRGQGAPLPETREPLEVTLGFYKLGGAGRDRAYSGTLSGAQLFNNGGYGEAAQEFRAAAAADPACLRCRYFLALALAASGDRPGALDEYKKAEKAAAGVLTAGHRRAVEALAAGDPAGADAALRALAQNDPSLFQQANLFGGIWRLRQGAGAR